MDMQINIANRSQGGAINQLYSGPLKPYNCKSCKEKLMYPRSYNEPNCIKSIMVIEITAVTLLTENWFIFAFKAHFCRLSVLIFFSIAPVALDQKCRSSIKWRT